MVNASCAVFLFFAIAVCVGFSFGQPNLQADFLSSRYFYKLSIIEKLQAIDVFY